MVIKTYADLHNHTTASDGAYSPKELVHQAKLNKLHAVGITDHDTTDGLDEAQRAGQEFSIEVVPGIELSTQIDNKDVHILGYYMDYNLPWFQDMLSTIRDERYTRAKKTVCNLVKQYGMDLDFQEVLKQSGGKANIGRPHIARAMIDKGIVVDIPEAFKRYLGEDCPGYVGRYKLSVKEAIEMINNAGGVPILAHPGLLENDPIIEELIPLSLMGIEAYHSKHNIHQSKYYNGIGRANGLIVTGGSDSHGDEFPMVGDIRIDYGIVAKLKKLAKCL